MFFWNNAVFMVGIVLLVGLFVVPKLSKKESIFVLTLVVLGMFAYIGL